MLSERTRRSVGLPQCSSLPSVRSRRSPWWKQAFNNTQLQGLGRDEKESMFLHMALNETGHGAKGDFPSSDDFARPYLAAWGSTVCHGYCPLGARKTYTDPSERAHHIFVAERKARCQNLSEDCKPNLLHMTRAGMAICTTHREPISVCLEAEQVLIEGLVLTQFGLILS